MFENTGSNQQQNSQSGVNAGGSVPQKGQATPPEGASGMPPAQPPMSNNPNQMGGNTGSMPESKPVQPVNPGFSGPEASPQQRHAAPPPQSAPMAGSIHAMPEKFQSGAVKAAGSKESETVSSSGGSSGKRLILIVGIVAIVLAGITGAAYVIFNNPALNPLTQNAGEVVPTENDQNTNEAMEQENTNEAMEQENTNELEESPLANDQDAIARDAQRVKDITAIAKALDTYYTQFDNYPQFLSLIPNDILSQNPRDPRTGAAYQYVVAQDRQSYELIFDVEARAEFKGETLSIGSYKLYPEDFTEEGADRPISSTVEDEEEVDLPDNLDSDSDGLTREEERVFKTSPNTDDTDRDGFKDLVEITNFYSPLQSGAVKLDQSGLVRLYTNSVNAYSFYYPAAWVVSVVDDAQNDVLLTTDSGEDFEFRVVSNPNELTSWEWYSTNISGDFDEDNVNLVTISGYEAVRTVDGLGAYISIGNKVFVIEYNLNNVSTINYPAIFTFILNNLTIS